MIDEFKIQLGKELKKLRVDKDVSIKELAQEAKVNSSTIVRYENGRCKDISTLKKLLDVYNCSFDIFFKNVYANLHK